MSHKQIYSYTNPKLEKRPVEGKGAGLFATQFIPADEVLAVWGGEIRTEAQLAELDPERHSYGLQVEEGYYLWSIQDGDTADYFNHSCEPNAGLSGQIVLVAMRDIVPGEEVTYDYAMTDGSSYDEFECQCGSASCRGRVTGVDWSLPDLQRRYAGYFSPYLQRRIEEALTANDANVNE